MSTEAELFTIRCGINQATNYNDVSKIIAVTNSIHATKKIFDSLPILFKVMQHLFLMSFNLSSLVIKRI